MDTPRVEVDEVIATALLEHRTPRVRDEHAEKRAMDEMRRGLAGSPRSLLQKLAEVALDLCNAQYAGVSLLEQSGEPRFCRWYAVSGEYRAWLWSTLPCATSPCGPALEQHQPMLMIRPERCFSVLAQLRPPVEELLLVPFAVHGEIAGTVWVVSHDKERVFDSEDSRIMTALTEFAAAAYEQLLSFGPEELEALSRLYQISEPPAERDP